MISDTMISRGGGNDWKRSPTITSKPLVHIMSTTGYEVLCKDASILNAPMVVEQSPKWSAPAKSFNEDDVTCAECMALYHRFQRN